MNKIIDGKVLARRCESLLKKRIKNLKRPPRLVSFSSYEDLQIDRYTELKGRKAAELGIEFIVIYTVDQMTFAELTEKIQQESADRRNDGVMIQLPLPPSLQTQTEAAIQLIDPQKDVDGLTGKGPFLPAHTKAVISILKTFDSLDNKVLAIVGSRGWAGSSITQMMGFRFPELIEIDQKLPGTSLNDLRQADLVISCTGVKNLIQPEQVKEGTILIDVGLGDFDPRCFEKASFYTPKIGGVGPVTIISLMENVTEALERRI